MWIYFSVEDTDQSIRLFLEIVGELIIRQRGSEDFLSIMGAMDPRFALYLDKSSFGVAHSDDANALIFPGTDYGSRATADVLVMASKLAYENAACVKKVVTQSWKVNSVRVIISFHTVL